MAALLFTVDLFSQVQKDNQTDNDETITSSLPTLRITQLMLKFEDIDEADRQNLFTQPVVSAARLPTG